jgi:hypothetical protein
MKSKPVQTDARESFVESEQVQRRGPESGRRQAVLRTWKECARVDGAPIDPSTSVHHAIKGGYPWFEIEYLRCKTGAIPPKAVPVILTAPGDVEVWMTAPPGGP